MWIRDPIIWIFRPFYAARPIEFPGIHVTHPPIGPGSGPLASGGRDRWECGAASAPPEPMVQHSNARLGARDWDFLQASWRTLTTVEGRHG